MGRIQRPLNYRTPLQRAADWLHARLREVRELGTARQWALELLGCLTLMLLFLLIYCLLP